MMKGLGYEILYYGTPGSVVDCDETIECIDEEAFLRCFSRNEAPGYQYCVDPDETEEGWRLFNRRCEHELKRRLDSSEIVVVVSGNERNFLSTIPHAVTVDAHAGHSSPYAAYTVYPSKSWRAFIYGKFYAQKYQNALIQQPYWDDAVIYHYLDLASFPFTPEKQDYLLFVGRLNPSKGVFFVIQACQELGIPLKVAGGLHPSSERLFLDYVAKHPLVDYVGTFDSAKRAEWMGQARCLLCPTLYPEPFGLVAIEAMAMGTPVIATDWGAFSETVVHGKTGFLISYYQDLLRSLQRIHEIDPLVCRKWVEANFTTDVVAPYYDRFFKRIMAIRSSDPASNPWYTADVGDSLPISQTLVYP